MFKSKTLITTLFVIFLFRRVQGQSLALIIEKVKNKKEYIIKPDDKIELEKTKKER